LLDIGSPSLPSAAGSGSAAIERLPNEVSDVRIHENRFTLCTPTGERHFDVAYLALGYSSQHDLARSLGASCDENGALQVDAHQQTTVPRLYAAGDVVRELNQVVVAAAESAIAATDIHNKLRGK